MNHRASALFIEPEGSLRACLLDRKAWLDASMPGQTYCNHPPHCTLVFGDYGDPSRWLESLRAVTLQTPAFEVETDSWQEFPHDALAEGGHTLAYRAVLDANLGQLQRKVAKTLAQFRQDGVTTHPLANREPFASSLREFGFPFVGPHWIPHFTIGSPRVAADDPLLARLKTGPVRHRFLVRLVSVWRVDGDRHERLHELALSPRQT
ncbi:MAG TPA: 2'-5' RNA ligase family protein [Candidatus Didemnitutus sp.]|nr:2'-5' RNA ligase family protein [Candidatus Didemnitutus sp.]